MNKTIWWSHVIPKLNKNFGDQYHLLEDKLLEHIRNSGPEEGYFSVFSFEARDTFNGYRGKTKPTLGLLYTDIDRAGKLDEALAVTRTYVEKLDIPCDIWFSGNKGFHIDIPAACFPDDITENEENIPENYGRFFTIVKNEYGLEDTCTTETTRKLSLPFSKHRSSGLFKTHITREELFKLSIEEIKEKAKTRQDPRTFSPVNSTQKSAFLQSIWEKALVQTPEILDTKEYAEDSTFYDQFERFGDKKCIQKMFTLNFPEGARHSTAIILISSLYNSGIPKDKAFSTISDWAKLNGIAGREDIIGAFNNIYSGKYTYSFGCKEPIKSAHCDAKCHIYKNLSPRARPKQVLNATKDQIKEQLKPDEWAVVRELLAGYNTANKKIITQDEDFFFYDNSEIKTDLSHHWIHIQKKEAEKKFKRDIDETLRRKGYSFLNGTIESMWKRMSIHIPSVAEFSKTEAQSKPINIFEPNGNLCNFRDKTIEIVQTSPGKYEIKEKPHDPKDLLLYKHPFDYDISAPYNEDFEILLENTWKNDPDKEAKKQLYYEILGASLCPKFPKIIFFIGDPGSGKTTLLKFIKKLIDPRFVCSIAPSDLENFNLETAVGKLVNIDFDIKTKKMLSDDILKKIEDRVSVRIRRKGIKDIYAPIPAIHCFGANSLPPSEESKTYDRRMLILRLANQAFTEDTLIRDYDQTIWDKNPAGIVRRAIEGLQRLCSNGGKFTKPESTIVEMNDWKDSYKTPFEMFIDDVTNGELPNVCSPIKIGPGLKIKTSHLWDELKKWFEDARVLDRVPLRKHEAHKYFRQKYSVVRGRYSNFYKGIGFENVDINSSETSDIRENNPAILNPYRQVQ